jgi:hypothetical protein
MHRSVLLSHVARPLSLLLVDCFDLVLTLRTRVLDIESVERTPKGSMKIVIYIYLYKIFDFTKTCTQQC